MMSKPKTGGRDEAAALVGTVRSAVLSYASSTYNTGGLALQALDAWHAILSSAENSLAFWVVMARREGTSWAKIGRRLNMTRQAAYQRYRTTVNQALSDEDRGWPMHWRLERGVCAACHRPLSGPQEQRHPDQQQRQATLPTCDRTITVCRRCYEQPGILLSLTTEPMIAAGESPNPQTG